MPDLHRAQHHSRGVGEAPGMAATVGSGVGGVLGGRGRWGSCRWCRTRALFLLSARRDSSAAANSLVAPAQPKGRDDHGAPGGRPVLCLRGSTAGAGCSWLRRPRPRRHVHIHTHRTEPHPPPPTTQYNTEEGRMAFVRSMARQMAHGVERSDVNLALRKWWKLGYTRQNGLVRACVFCVCGWGGGWLRAAVLLLRICKKNGGVMFGSYLCTRRRSFDVLNHHPPPPPPLYRSPRRSRPSSRR